MSSPTAASFIASLISGVGVVTETLLKSIIFPTDLLPVPPSPFEDFVQRWYSEF